jgi:seryl-tRNA synthetase
MITNIENVINKIANIEEKEKEIDTKLNEYLKTLGFMS